MKAHAKALRHEQLGMSGDITVIWYHQNTEHIAKCLETWLGDNNLQMIKIPRKPSEEFTLSFGGPEEFGAVVSNRIT